MLEELDGREGCRGLAQPFVCLGTLVRSGRALPRAAERRPPRLRDTETSRELVRGRVEATGIKRNRRRVLLIRSEIIAVCRSMTS